MDISVIAEAVIAELATAHEGHSCIMAAAVLLAALRELRIKGAYPLTVKPRVLNPAFVERLKQTQAFPTTQEEIAEWSAAGCSMVAVGHGEGRFDGWPAHLVVVMPNMAPGKALVIDLTITQASVPDWGIELRPLAFPAPATFLSGTTEFKAPVNGSIVVYQAFPDDRSYEQTPLWIKKKKRRAIVREVLRRLGAGGLR